MPRYKLSGEHNSYTQVNSKLFSLEPNIVQQ